MSGLAVGPNSVRVQVTAVAVVVVGVTLVVGSWGLVTAVRSSLVDDLRADGRRDVLRVAALLRAGVPPEDLRLAPERPTRLVQVIGPTGEVLAPAEIAAAPAPLPGGDGVVVTEHLEARGRPFTVVAAAPLEEVERSVSVLVGALRLAIPALVVLVGGLAWWLVGRSLHPIEAIRAEVEEISGTTIHRRVPEPVTDDEVSRLARTMNTMLERLEDASRRQRQFVSDASHELRSPVAAIRTELEVALRHPDGANWRSVAENVLAEDQRLEHVVGDLVELARLDEAAPVHDDGEVDLDDVALEEAARIRTTPVGTAGVEPGRVRGNRAQLGRVVRNLLENAARHARGRVDLEVAANGDWVLLAVEDDGPGIPATDRERVFERFGRLDDARSSGDGVGLGLAVVRRIVERHGGTVRVVDGVRLAGARFEVLLPAVSDVGASTD